MASDDEPTCGKGIAASADLPEKMSGLMRGMADLFENHVRSLDPSEKAGQAEIAAYKRLSSDHHALGDQLKALAGVMLAYRTLPMGSHNMEILMDKASSDSFVRLVESEKELLSLLKERVEEHSMMLEAMQLA